jgi:hypothetical protein
VSKREILFYTLLLLLLLLHYYTTTTLLYYYHYYYYYYYYTTILLLYAKPLVAAKLVELALARAAQTCFTLGCLWAWLCDR